MGMGMGIAAGIGGGGADIVGLIYSESDWFSGNASLSAALRVGASFPAPRCTFS